jgi:hypothetical protein
MKLLCRKAKDADPANFPANTHYIYSKATSTSSLRPHILKKHSDLYLRLAKEKGWKVQSVSQARSQASSEAATLDRPPDKFDEQTFHQHLLRFIVVDDHVCPCLYPIFIGYNYISSLWLSSP